MTDRDHRMDDEPGPTRPGDLTPDGSLDPALARALDPAELTEITRLDEALAALDRGEAPDVDAVEDPELHALVTAARVVDHSFEATTTTRAFNSFHHRSRNAILHTLEADRPVPFRERVRVTVAAAAGIAAVVLGVATLGGPVLDGLREGGTAEAPGASITVANLTHLQTQEQLDRLSLAVDGLRHRALSGQSLSSAQLHEFTENAARVADSIERQPDTVSPEAVRAYMERNQAAQEALNSGSLEPGAEDAAVAAQRAAEDGIVVASRYLGGEGGADGSPLPGSTGTPDDGWAALGTETPTETPTDSPTGTPTESPTGTPESTETPESPEPTETAEPTEPADDPESPEASPTSTGTTESDTTESDTTESATAESTTAEDAPAGGTSIASSTSSTPAAD